MKADSLIRSVQSLIPQKIQLRQSPIRGTTAILSPKERAVLSTPSRSDFAGTRAAIRVYPGRKSKGGSPSKLLIICSFSPSVSTKISVRSTSPITIKRSEGFVLQSLGSSGLIKKLFSFLSFFQELNHLSLSFLFFCYFLFTYIIIRVFPFKSPFYIYFYVIGIFSAMSALILIFLSFQIFLLSYFGRGRVTNTKLFRGCPTITANKN